ncbi:hypothetical protein R6Q57_029783 [Mikania cordata]
MVKSVMGGNGFLYPVLGFASVVVFLYMTFGDLLPVSYKNDPKLSFVERNGTNFVVDGKVFYVNGWNSYWFMDHAVFDYSRPRIREMLQAGAKMGLTVCRTWAFNDGDYNALQIAPGQFDERVFKALDYVIAEARQVGIRLLFSLVNNLQAYGGKTQYVKWAWDEGVGLSASNDSFFFDPSIRLYFKNYVKTILTRKNTITGVVYRDDPTIFGWELINEPRCITDASGDTLQDWIEEMSSFIKSIDRKHMLTIGLEGFYGPNSPKKDTVNPEFWAADLGADFIRNSAPATVDFASVHIYPDHWFKKKSLEGKLMFVSKWMRSHIEDGDQVLKKPVMFTEFGLSDQNKGFDPQQRDRFYKTVFDVIYESAKKKGAGGGSFAWQFFVEGMEEYNDDFGIVPWKRASTYEIITQHTCRLAKSHGMIASQKNNLKHLCNQR